MGIPSYYKYITEQYDNLIIRELSIVNRLFLDLNGCIHPCCHTVLKEYPNLDHQALELKIYQEVVNYIEYLVKLSQPRDLLFVSIDGVAPRAKMQQQRYRRFKSAKEKLDKQKIYEKYKQELPQNQWDTNAITPGTLFMEKLSIYLRTEIPKKSFNVSKIILSDSNDPGEGEHKIFEFIKEHNESSINDIVYGLDADLIMLSMTIENSQIFLLRESIEFGNMIDVNEDGMPNFLYLDINCFKKALLEDLSENGLVIKNSYRVLCDYICLCFLLGNDFLPHILSLGIKNGGINILLEYYTEIQQKYIEESPQSEQYLVHIDRDSNYSLNNNFFGKIIEKLSNSENELLSSFSKSLLRSRIRQKECKNALERALHVADFLPVFNRDIDKYINMGSHNWRQRYYETCFHMESQQEIDHICLSFLQGISWTLQYYFKKCINYEWYYSYRHPPGLLDLKYYLEKHQPDINKLINTGTKKYTPFTQLLIVLPSVSFKLLPEPYQSLMISSKSNLIDCYPTDVELDTVGKFLTWQCLPKLPDIDDQRIIDAIQDIEISQEDQSRGKLSQKFQIK